MKKNDYRNHFDRIRCSAEFRRKMEERLSDEPDGEYEDSVSDVEYAPKVNYHRWTALIASAVLVAGIGGMALLCHRNIIPEESPGSSFSGYYHMPPDAEIQHSVSVDKTADYNISLSVSGIFSQPENHSMPFGLLPEGAVDDIVTEIDSWTELQNVPSVTDTSARAVTLYFTGDDVFTLKIDSNGYACINHNNSKTDVYYSPECYTSLLEIIAGYIPWCDWTHIIDGIRGDKISTAFKNHIDEIERTVFSVSENSMEFFERGSFSGCIEPDGGLTIYCYMMKDETIAVNFKSSPELYEEIYSAMNNEITETISENDTMFYANGSGQKSKTIRFSDFDTESLCMLIDYNGWTWTAGTGEYPEGEFFGIGSFIIQADNSIYDCNTGILYRAENQDEYGIFSVLENMITQNNAEYISYLIASSDNRFDTLSGNVYYSSADYIDGKGELYYDNKNNNEYVFISGDDSSNSIEFIMQENQWELTHITDGVSQNDSGSSFTERVMIDYEYIKDELLLYINNSLSDNNLISITRNDDFWNISIEYDTDEETVSVQANLDDLGNVIYMSVFRYNSNSINEQKIFYLGDGYGEGVTYDEPALSKQYGF